MLAVLAVLGCAEEECDPPGSGDVFFEGEIVTDMECESAAFGCSNDAAVCIGRATVMTHGEEAPVPVVVLRHKGLYRVCSEPDCSDAQVPVERWCDLNPDCAW